MLAAAACAGNQSVPTQTNLPEATATLAPTANPTPRLTQSFMPTPTTVSPTPASKPPILTTELPTIMPSRSPKTNAKPSPTLAPSRAEATIPVPASTPKPALAATLTPTQSPSPSPSPEPTTTPVPTPTSLPSAPDCPTDLSKPLFEVSPIQMSDIRGIVPLGNLNPPGHTLPTQHIYFYIRMTGAEPSTPASVPVFAPGHIWITSIEEKLYASPPTTDYSITFKPCNQFAAYFHHVQKLSAELLVRVGSFEGSGCDTSAPVNSCRKHVMIEMQAGEVIGVAGGEGHLALDLGAIDGRVSPLVYANPARFWSSASGLDQFHMVCPIDYYVPDLRVELRGRLGDFTGQTARTAEPICGEVEQDEPGTAQGNWYQRGTVGGPPFPYGSQIALVHSNFDPSLGAFSIGTLVPGLGTGAYYFRPQTFGRVNLDFSEVISDGNVYCYDSMFGLAGYAVSPAQIILVQLTTEATLRIEKIDAAECGAGPWAFQANFADFER